MASQDLPVPFLPLPPDELSPADAVADMAKQDLLAVRWLVGQESVSPLGRILETVAAWEPSESGDPIEAVALDERRFQLHSFLALRRLGWAIRALCAGGRVRCDIDQTFKTKELLGGDSKEKSIDQKLPGGVGTIYFAGLLAQAGGGGSFRITGNGVKGYDIRWESPGGNVLLVERKDRSYAAGLGDSNFQRASRVAKQLGDEGRNMPTEKGAARIFLVGFQHLVAPKEANALGAIYVREIEKRFAHDTSRDLPHAVLIEHAGVEPRTNGQKSLFWCPVLLRPSERALAGIWDVVQRAITG